MFNIAALLSLLSATTVALAFEFADRPIEEALHELEARGLSILYSSDLVKPGMRVLEAPSALAAAPATGRDRAAARHQGSGRSGRNAAADAGHARSTCDLPWPAEPALAEVVVTASRYAWVRIPQPSLTRLSEAELRLAPNVGDDPLRTFARLPGAVGSDLSADSTCAAARRTKRWCASTACD